MVKSAFQGCGLFLGLGLLMIASCDEREDVFRLDGFDATVAAAFGEAGNAPSHVMLRNVATFEWDHVKAVGGGLPSDVVANALGDGFEAPAGLAQNATLLVFFPGGVITGQAVLAGPAFISVNETLEEVPADRAALVRPSADASGVLLEAR